MNYGESYRQGVQALTAAGIDEAEPDARLLLEFVCGTTRQHLLAHPERPVTEAEQKSYVNLIARRAAHIPLQYLTGIQEFMGLRFAVSEDVLIPRQDTEILVEEAMRFLHDGMRVLDLCTGSGCILLSLLHYSNGCSGVGTDISAKALAVAKENAVGLGVTNAAWAEGDLFCAVTGKFDMIVSNPPYIPSGVIATLMPEVKDHEPGGALDGGGDGLDFYRRIAAQAGAYLCGGGQLFLEIGCEQAAAVQGLLCQRGFADVHTVQDYAGLDRVIYGTWL